MRIQSPREGNHRAKVLATQASGQAVPVQAGVNRCTHFCAGSGMKASAVMGINASSGMFVGLVPRQAS